MTQGATPDEPVRPTPPPDSAQPSAPVPPPGAPASPPGNSPAAAQVPATAQVPAPAQVSPPSPEEPAADTGRELGLKPGKVLQEAFRHPTKHFVMLPRGTILRPEFIEAIRLMGCEREAIMCLGEIVTPDTPIEPDVLHDGPIAAARIDREVRILRQARDVLALFLAILFIFALALRFLLLVVLAILAVLGWGALHLLAVSGAMKIEAISEGMNEARVRRVQGETQLQEAALKFGLLKQNRE